MYIISDTEILNEEKVKLLRANLEARFSFDFHVNTLLKIARIKYHALGRVSNYINKNNPTYSHDSFQNISVFCYCPLDWMFHSRTTNSRINKIHEKFSSFSQADYKITNI